MWVRWLIAISLVFAVGFIYYQRTQVPVLPGRHIPVVRSASNVVFYEKKADSGLSTRITASKVVEKTDQVALLDDFKLSRSDGLHVYGNHAEYDVERLILNVIGRVYIETNDKRKAALDGLLWDRNAKEATTDRPIRVEGMEGVIVARSAKFFDDFNKICLLGGVHASISQDIFSN